MEDTDKANEIWRTMKGFRVKNTHIKKCSIYHATEMHAISKRKDFWNRIILILTNK